MTEIYYDDAALRVEARGHAGYARAGEDIVCAALTALLCTLPAALTGRGIRIEYRPTPEYSLTALPRSDQRYPCLVVMETILEGLKLLERDYPENVRVERR